MPYKKTAIAGLKTSVYEQGEEHPLLILHGWGSQAASWETLAVKLASKKRMLIIPDLPGFGEADPPPGSWSVDDYAGWVRALLAAYGLKHCDVIGHSFGGRIAIKLASSEPEVVDRLVLCASAGLRSMSWKARIKRSLFKGLAKLGRALQADKLLGSASSRLLYRLAGEHDYQKTSGVMRETFKRVIAEDLRESLPLISRPVLLLWGENDRLTPLGDGQEMSKKIAQADLRVLAQGGHNFYKDDIGWTSEQINSWLSDKDKD